MTTAKAPHTLIIDDDRCCAIQCHGVTDHCRAWIEADCPEAQPRDEWDDMPWFDWAGEEIAHGVTHADLDGGWSHPTDDCWLRCYPDLPEIAAGLGLPPGRYTVVHEYVCGGDGEFELELVDVAVPR